MNENIQHMLERYECCTENDYVNAIREIMQELALQGLWRGKFFESAAFYGGMAPKVVTGMVWSGGHYPLVNLNHLEIRMRHMSSNQNDRKVQ